MKALKWPSKKPAGDGEYSFINELIYYVVTDIQACPFKLWASRLLMTLWFIPVFIFHTIIEWRAVTRILKWELWVPDYEKTREEFSVIIKHVRDSR